MCEVDSMASGQHGSPMRCGKQTAFPKLFPRSSLRASRQRVQLAQLCHAEAGAHHLTSEKHVLGRRNPCPETHPHARGR